VRGTRTQRKPEGGTQVEARASLAQLFLHDFRRAGDHWEESAARERVRALDPVPGFLLSIHFICAAALILGLAPRSHGAVALLVPLIVLLAAETTLWLLFRRFPISRMAPHAAVRGGAVYALFANLVWFAIIAVAGADHSDGALALDFALVGGALAVPVAFLAFPALAAIGSLACVATLLLRWQDPLGAVAGILLSYCFVRLSLNRAADQRTVLKARLAAEWNAQRASRFIEEFEQAGRGWFWETNARGALTYVSDPLAADLKTPADALIGKPFMALIGADDSGGPDASGRTLGFHLSARLPFTDIRVRANASADLWWSLSGTPGFDDHGRFLGFRGIGADLTQQRRSEDEINRLARYDSLTGLPNRTLMRRTLDEALEPKPGPAGTVCALFLIDLDRFKNVNDTLGHPIGDALLKQVALRLQTVIADHGQIGRLGGDEFEAILPGMADEATLAALAARLIQQVSMPYLIEGHGISIGASIGIAIASGSKAHADALIRNADLALYSAKAAGRGQHRFFAPEMHSEAQDRQMLENDLRKAIARGELQLHFQPVVEATSEALAGFEALVRWHHPARGVISPSLFVPLAEECGLILQIGEWVLREACAEAARWPDHVRVAVNLSPVQFGEAGLPATILSAIANAGIPARQLELEITEGVFLIESETTDDMFAALKGIGVRLALDDFGTGYSSLGYLKKTPFDKIKIDQSFVRGAARQDSRNAAIIRAIVSLAQSLGMDTTAEGAETHDELALIRALGCSHIQGYIFGRPMTPDEAADLARDERPVQAEGFEFNRPPRQGLLKVATLQWNGVTLPVKVRNISSGGALLETGRTLPLGAVVQLDLPGCGPLGAAVRWSDPRRIGLQFDDEFDLRRLAARAAAPYAPPRSARAG
jgi:diguanylate cyclase (GGDEF)-like protein